MVRRKQKKPLNQNKMKKEKTAEQWLEEQDKYCLTFKSE